MKIELTPGKWDIRYERDPFDSKQSTLRIIDPATTGHPQGPLTLATINVAAFAPHMEEPFANARLMVTAPELLAALIEVEQMIQANEINEGTMQVVRNAIAKAKNKIIEDN